MGGSILAEKDRFSLGNGMHLRLLTGAQLLQARRQAARLARYPEERPLCSNACLVAFALWEDGAKAPLFSDPEQVLDTLTAEEIEVLARRWDMFRRGSVPGGDWQEGWVNPNFLPGGEGA